MKKISIFGFTGNLGTQALDILKSYKNQFEFDIFVCDKNINLAESVVREFNPKSIFFSCEEAKKEFKNLGDVYFTAPLSLRTRTPQGYVG